MTLNIEYQPSTFGLIVRYTPVSPEGDRLPEWTNSLNLRGESMPAALQDKLTIFFGVVARFLPGRLRSPVARSSAPGSHP